MPDLGPVRTGQSPPRVEGRQKKGYGRVPGTSSGVVKGPQEVTAVPHVRPKGDLTGRPGVLPPRALPVAGTDFDPPTDPEVDLPGRRGGSPTGTTSVSRCPPSTDSGEGWPCVYRRRDIVGDPTPPGSVTKTGRSLETLPPKDGPTVSVSQDWVSVAPPGNRPSPRRKQQKRGVDLQLEPQPGPGREWVAQGRTGTPSGPPKTPS